MIMDIIKGTQSTFINNLNEILYNALFRRHDNQKAFIKSSDSTPYYHKDAP